MLKLTVYRCLLCNWLVRGRQYLENFDADTTIIRLIDKFGYYSGYFFDEGQTPVNTRELK